MNSRDRTLKRLGRDLSPAKPVPTAPAPLDVTESATRANLNQWVLRHTVGRILQAGAIVIWIYMTIAHGKAGFVFGLVGLYAVCQTMPRQDDELDKYTGRK